MTLTISNENCKIWMPKELAYTQISNKMMANLKYRQIEKYHRMNTIYQNFQLRKSFFKKCKM